LGKSRNAVKTNPMVFFKVRWLETYTEGDQNEIANEYCYERLNFQEINGKCRGHGHIPHGGKGVDLEKVIGKKFKEGDTGTADVVFISDHRGEIVVVGWYLDATIFHKSKKTLDGVSDFHYVCEVNSKSAFLLREEYRTKMLKIGYLRPQIWYADGGDEKTEKLRKVVSEYIHDNHSDELVPRPTAYRKKLEEDADKIRAMPKSW